MTDDEKLTHAFWADHDADMNDPVYRAAYEAARAKPGSLTPLAPSPIRLGEVLGKVAVGTLQAFMMFFVLAVVLSMLGEAWALLTSS